MVNNLSNHTTAADSSCTLYSEVILTPSEVSEAVQQSKQWSTAPVWVKSFHLNQNNRECILDGSELTDRHIDAANILMKKQFPHIGGLDSPLTTMSTTNEKAKSPHMQILHSKSRQHWVLSTNINNSIIYIDSLYSGVISDDIVVQLKKIYGEECSMVTVPYVQQQKGATDCGLFCIAFAIAIGQGQHIQTLCFKQNELRRHLHDCFSAEELLPFPVNVMKDLMKKNVSTRVLSI